MCVYSKVLLIKNLKQVDNLINKSVGFMKEIMYAKNETPVSNLPMYAIVDFGDRYTDKIFSR